MPLFTKILVPTDFEDPARSALDAAVELAALCGSSITLIHCYSIPTSPYVEGLVWPTEALVQASQVALDQEVARGRLKLAGIDSILVLGQPWRAIVDAVKDRGFDLVVMGTHGRRGVAHLVLGSVAERVVRAAACPVLTVPSAV